MSNSTLTPVINPRFIFNGIDQIVGVVSGVDPRQKGTKVERTFWIGQYFRNPDGTVDYDTFFLYDSLDTHWEASEYPGGWNDITCRDMREADLAYDSLTVSQKYKVDWVRGMANQVGCLLFQCFEEPGWQCAVLSGEDQIIGDPYEIVVADVNQDLAPLNSYEPVKLTGAVPLDVRTIQSL